MSVEFSALLGHQFQPENVLSVRDVLNNSIELKDACFLLLQEVQKNYPKMTYDLSWNWFSFATGSIVEADKVTPEMVMEHNSDPAKDLITLDGPALLQLTVGEHAVWLFGPARWSGFLTDARRQLLLRQVCFRLAHCIGSSRMIYLPDSFYEISRAFDFVFEGGTLDEIEAWLRDNHGLPEPSLKHFIEPVQHYEGYFIDYFEGLNT